jgi:isocitrate lyase
MSDKTTHPTGRGRGIEPPYTAADVSRLRGTVRIEHSLARLGAEKFRRLPESEVADAGATAHEPKRVVA